MLKHTGQYLCAECGKNVHTHEEWKKHEESHKDEFLQAVLTCITCNKQFLNEHLIKQHMQSKHSSPKEIFPVGHPQRYQKKAVSQNIACLKCSKVFATGSEVEDHNNVRKMKPVVDIKTQVKTKYVVIFGMVSV